MAQQALLVKVFVASPGDTNAERERLEGVVGELNRGIAAELGISLELVRWETHARPGIGDDAQAVINRQVPEPDIVIGIFWKRIGTPTPRAQSGTAEELLMAIERWKQTSASEILVYFNQVAYTPLAVDIGQVSELFVFREQLQSAGLLVWEYKGVDDFEAKVRQHLTAALRQWPVEREPVPSRPVDQAADASPSPPPPGTEVDTRSGGRVNRFVAATRETLRDQGFSQDVSDRVATAIQELLANVKQHAADPVAVVQIDASLNALRHVSIEVLQQDEAFDVSALLEAGWQRYQAGDREHGLVRVTRLTGGIYPCSDTTSGWSGIGCDVYELPRLSSRELTDRPGVTTISLEYDVPARCWLNDQVFTLNELNTVLAYALNEPAPRILDLYLGGLRPLADGYLGIQVTGNVAPSEVSIEIWRLRQDPEAKSTLPLFAALEQRFREFFEAGRVVMYVHEAGQVPTALLEAWADAWGLPLCRTTEDLDVFLAANGK